MATSLSEGEVKDKQVGVLTISGKDFKIDAVSEKPRTFTTNIILDYEYNSGRASSRFL